MLDSLRDFVTAHATAIVAVAIFIAGGCFGYLLEFGIDQWRRGKQKPASETTDVPAADTAELGKATPYGSQPDPQHRPPTMADLDRFSEHVADDLGEILTAAKKQEKSIDDVLHQVVRVGEHLRGDIEDVKQRKITDDAAIRHLLPKLEPEFDWYKLEHVTANADRKIAHRRPVDASLTVEAGEYRQRITFRACLKSNVRFFVDPVDEPILSWHLPPEQETPELFPEQFDPPL